MISLTSKKRKKPDLSILPYHHSCHFHSVPECPHSLRMAAAAPAPPPTTMSKARQAGSIPLYRGGTLPLKSSSRFPVFPLFVCGQNWVTCPLLEHSLAKSLRGGWKGVGNSPSLITHLQIT